MAKQVLILHGWTNRRLEGSWQRQTAVALRKLGHQVHYPQLPNPDEPRFADWAEVALNELGQIAEGNSGEEVVVIGHSLGAVTWLKLVADGLVPSLSYRVLLVAPADPSLLIDIPDFIVDVAAAGSAVRSHDTTLVASGEDPWQPNGIEAIFDSPLKAPVVTIPGARHFSLSDGWGDWAGVINWIKDSASDLSIR
ncbi:MAG: alpha/beta fold hydrolase [Rhodoluna sp.]|nr:alpha/beta fold hydrolase [Rhodoluna sp.]